MSVTGAQRAKVRSDSGSLEPKLVYDAEHAGKERQAQRLLLLWALRRTPLKVFAVLALASIALPFLIRNSYMATSQIMPPENMSNSNMAMLSGITAKTGPLSGMAADLLNLKTSAGLFIGVLTSRNVLDHLVKQFNLTQVYRVKDEDEAQAKLSDRTYIHEDKSSGLIVISVTDHDPQRAAAMANAYVEQLNSLLAQLSTSSARTERLFLEERLRLIKENLDKASDQLAQFSSSTDTLDPQQEGKAMLDAAGNITAQLVASEAQLQGLREIYKDRHPRVRALNARVEQLRRELKNLGGAHVSGDLPAGTRESSAGTTETDGSTAYPSIHSLPILGAKYSDFYRRVKIQESVYELLTGQYELAKVQEVKEIPTLKILDAAKPPRKKVSPNRPLLIVLGMFVSFGVATVCWVGLMLWHEVDPLDPRFRLIHELTGAVRRRFLRSAAKSNKTTPETLAPLQQNSEASD